MNKKTEKIVASLIAFLMIIQNTVGINATAIQNSHYETSINKVTVENESSDETNTDTFVVEDKETEENQIPDMNSEKNQEPAKDVEPSEDMKTEEHLGNEPNKEIEKPLIVQNTFEGFKDLKTGEVISPSRITYENPIMALSDHNISFGAGTGYYSKVTNADGVHMVYNANQPIIYVNGEVAFCVEPGVEAHQGGGYIPEFVEWGDLAIIAYEGWEMSDHSAEAYLATQFMIWEYFGATIESNFYAYSLYKADIQYKVDHHSDKPSFQSGNYELTVGETIRIHDTNEVLNKFSVYSNDGLDVAIDGNDLVITGTLAAKENSIIHLIKIPTNYQGSTIVYKKPGSQDIATFMVHDPIPVNIAVKVNKYGTLKLAKVDESGNAVPGTTFKTSYNADMSGTTWNYTTGADGTVTIPNWLPQKVYIQETSVPSPLVIDNSIKSVTIVPNETVTYTATNKYAKGRLTINKVDSATNGAALGDATLEGAIYGIYAKNAINHPFGKQQLYAKDALVSKLTIKNGTASVEGLWPAEYYLKEISPSHGYTLDPTVYPVTVSYTDPSATVINVSQTVKERVIAQAFEIIKISSNGDPGETPLVEGAEFTIKLKSDIYKYGSWEAAPIAKNAKGLPAAVMITDFKGYAISDELPFGTYVVRETLTPENHYTVDDFTITINEDSRIPQTWRVFNDAPFEAMLKVVKLDAETGKSITLSNATFKIKDLQTGEYLKQWIYYPIPHAIDEFTTSDEGYFYTPALMMYGKYQLEEIKTPDEYLTLKDPIVFEIGSVMEVELAPDGKTPVIKIEVPNEPIKGQITIEKKAEIFRGYDYRQTDLGKIYEPIFEQGYLEGVKFQLTAAEDIITNDGTLWYEEGDVVEEIITGNEAYLTKLLPLGKYNLEEVETVDGYVLDGKTYEIELTAEDNVTPIILHTESKWNIKQRGSISFHKSMEDSHFAENPLQSVSYGLFTAEALIINDNEELPVDSLLSVVQPDEHGDMSFNIDFAGKYYVQELTTDDSYVLDSTKHYFEFHYSEENTSLTELKFDSGISRFDNQLKKGSFDIIKTSNEPYPFIQDVKDIPEYLASLKDDNSTVNSNQKFYLEGVEFEVALDKDFEEIVQKGTTDENGYLQFTGLELGKYYWRESKCLDGFVLDTTIHEIVITDEESTQTFELENEVRRSWIEVSKEDILTHKKLPYAGFTLYADPECKIELAKAESDKSGIAIFDGLLNGTYYFKETSAPQGYILSDEVVKVVIDTNEPPKAYKIIYNNSPLQDDVQTGIDNDDINIHLFLGGFVLSAAALLILNRKKKSKKG